MRRFSIVLATLVVCSAPSWADTILPPDTELDVNAWATFTAPVTEATETIGVSFLYDTPSIPYEYGQVVPGTMSVGSSGFLGTFNAGMIELGYLPLYNSANRSGDEIDLNWFLSSTGGIPTGINADYFWMWSCQSQACASAYGETWSGNPLNTPGGASSEGSVVTLVHVPDGDSSALLSLSAFGAFALAWCWRRKELNERER